jgi:hypothetical protein
MQYVLGNMLNGAGGLNPDGLSLDLQFAADKTLTARKGPTPVFTRASTATFVGSNGLIQTAATNIPRFDHDPVTLACRGLLIEESRTNIVFPSDALATQTRTVTAVAHTLSFYGTGTVVLSGTHSATVVGTGAYPTRTTLTFTPTAGSLTLTVTGSVTQAQLEAGALATSYIPTTTGSVVRSADVCSYTDVSSFYNLAAGTLVGDLILYTPSPSANPELFRFGAANNRIQFGVTNVASEAIRPFIISGGTQTYSSTQGTTVAGTSRKVAIAFATNDAISCLNGTLGTQDTSVTMPVSISTAVIGVSSFTGHIAAIRYYKKRLSNAKLQALTA